MSNRQTHVDLIVEGGRSGETQPVEVEVLSSDTFRVLFSPGLVEGIAAGEIENYQVILPSNGQPTGIRRSFGARETPPIGRADSVIPSKTRASDGA